MLDNYFDEPIKISSLKAQYGNTNAIQFQFRKFFYSSLECILKCFYLVSSMGNQPFCYCHSFQKVFFCHRLPFFLKTVVASSQMLLIECLLFLHFMNTLWFTYCHSESDNGTN